MRFMAGLLRRLWRSSALSPRRLLTRLRALRTRAPRARRSASAAHDVAEADEAAAEWHVTPAERAAVTEAWAAGPASQLLVLLDSGLQLTRRDLRTLRGSAWLNDEVVNFYLQLAVERAAEGSRRGGARGAQAKPPRTHVFSSHFFAKLACGKQGYDYSAVRRWTKAVDVYSYDLLLVPVNHSNSHWTLAAVWPAQRRIDHFCSLSGGAAREVLPTLALYMAHEARDKRSPEEPPPAAGRMPPGWTGCRVRAGVPRQRDSSACGVFVAAMAARLAAGRRPPFGLGQEDVPALRLRIAADCLARRATAV